ncbi:hypothetical protein AAEO56_02410 [Flavobacterium sp. DGU11]|uniref:Lipocalin-like domain-containing protein n=1 Tax=Flavobacterium arundinis TaxID=3139143 RepID=A0ABU9HSZ5_9FLAO
MIQKITLLFGLLLSFATFSQETGCAKFKNGTFKVTDPASKKVCIIKRDGNVQTERMEESDETYDFDLVWIDDCTYTVTPTASTSARNKEVLKAGTMTVKITKVTDSSYVQKVTVANNPKFRRVDEVFLMESK